jgi:hypothetical protein
MSFATIIDVLSLAPIMSASGGDSFAKETLATIEME